MNNLKRTQLYDVHVAAGAAMVDFSGWEMPIEYPGKIVSEHLCTRSMCSLFDVSHMGRILVDGAEAVPFLQHVLTSDVSAILGAVTASPPVRTCKISSDLGPWTAMAA